MPVTPGVFPEGAAKTQPQRRVLRTIHNIVRQHKKNICLLSFAARRRHLEVEFHDFLKSNILYFKTGGAHSIFQDGHLCSSNITIINISIYIAVARHLCLFNIRICRIKLPFGTSQGHQITQN